MKKFKFKAKLIRHGKMDATYVIFPYDVKENFGASRVKVKVKFDGVLYRGSLVRMGLAEGYPLIITKDVSEQISKVLIEIIEAHNHTVVCFFNNSPYET